MRINYNRHTCTHSCVSFNLYSHFFGDDSTVSSNSDSVRQYDYYIASHWNCHVEAIYSLRLKHNTARRFQVEFACLISIRSIGLSNAVRYWLDSWTSTTFLLYTSLFPSLASLWKASELARRERESDDNNGNNGIVIALTSIPIDRSNQWRKGQGRFIYDSTSSSKYSPCSCHYKLPASIMFSS